MVFLGVREAGITSSPAFKERPHYPPVSGTFAGRLLSNPLQKAVLSEMGFTAKVTPVAAL